MMKKITGKLLTAFMVSLFLFVSCANDSDGGSSGGSGGGSDPYVPAEDPVIEDGTYFFDKNTIVELKTNSKGKSDGYVYLKEYVDFQGYQKESSAEADDEIYEKAWRRPYDVEWLGRTCVRKVRGTDGTLYYLYTYGSYTVMRSEKPGAGYFETNLAKLADVKDKWALPENATYVSEKKYDDTNYLYAVISDNLKTVTFYKDETNTATPSGDTNKIGDMKNTKWDFSKSVVRASNGDWRLAVRKVDTDLFIVVTNDTESSGSDSKIFSVKCVKKD